MNFVWSACLLKCPSRGKNLLLLVAHTHIFNTHTKIYTQEMERIIKQNFRRFRDLGVPGANANADSSSNSSSSSTTSSSGSSDDEPYIDSNGILTFTIDASSDDEPSSPSSRSSKRRNKKAASAQNPAAGPLPTLDQVIDDTLALARTMGEQIRLFESTSVTGTSVYIYNKINKCVVFSKHKLLTQSHSSLHSYLSISTHTCRVLWN